GGRQISGAQRRGCHSRICALVGKRAPVCPPVLPAGSHDGRRDARHTGGPEANRGRDPGVPRPVAVDPPEVEDAAAGHSYTAATIVISMCAPPGSAATSTVVRPGGASWKYSA